VRVERLIIPIKRLCRHHLLLIQVQHSGARVLLHVYHIKALVTFCVTYRCHQDTRKRCHQRTRGKPTGDVWFGMCLLRRLFPHVRVSLTFGAGATVQCTYWTLRTSSTNAIVSSLLHQHACILLLLPAHDEQHTPKPTRVRVMTMLFRGLTKINPASPMTHHLSPSQPLNYTLNEWKEEHPTGVRVTALTPDMRTTGAKTMTLALLFTICLRSICLIRLQCHQLQEHIGLCESLQRQYKQEATWLRKFTFPNHYGMCSFQAKLCWQHSNHK
jgi:hypothetical protein